MSSSSTYWHFAEEARDELMRISSLAEDAYHNLESNDDPGALADELSEVKRRLDKASEQIGVGVPALKKSAAALSAVPVFTGSGK